MKNLDERIALADELIRRRKECDEGLQMLFGGGSPGKRGRKKKNGEAHEEMESNADYQNYAEEQSADA